MVLRAFYFIRALTKALIHYYINRSQRHLLVAIENNRFGVFFFPILFISRLLFSTEKSFAPISNFQLPSNAILHSNDLPGGQESTGVLVLLLVLLVVVELHDHAGHVGHQALSEANL